VKLIGKFSLRGEARDFWSGAPKLGVTTDTSRQHNLFVGGGRSLALLSAMLPTPTIVEFPLAIFAQNASGVKPTDVMALSLAPRFGMARYGSTRSINPTLPGSLTGIPKAKCRGTFLASLYSLPAMLKCALIGSISRFGETMDAGGAVRSLESFEERQLVSVDSRPMVLSPELYTRSSHAISRVVAGENSGCTDER